MAIMVFSERKQQILESCKPVFAEKGFYGSSSKELAASAKISEALLYKHFPTKEILFRATVEEAIAPYTKVRDTARCAPPKGETNFLRSIAKSALKPDEQTFRLLLFAYLELDKRYLNDFLKIFEDKTSDFLKNKQRDGLITQNKHSQKIIISCLVGLNLLNSEVSTTKNSTELVDEFARLMLPGLCK